MASVFFINLLIPVVKLEIYCLFFSHFYFIFKGAALNVFMCLNRKYTVSSEHELLQILT